jgi:hypothetical protein
MQRRGLMLAGAGVVAGSLLARHAAAGPPVVIELFTSQGCSSCPPADRLLGELARDPAVVALAWHVDYWNGLGWPDPFATKLASDRQRAYADRLGEDVYTPALVIGGTRMVIGSDRNEIRSAIQAAAPPAVPVAIVSDGDGLAAAIGAAGQQVTALLALYEPEHVTDVARGENGGRQLHEYHIVRGAMPLGIWDGGPRRLPLPPVPAGYGAAVLVQGANLRVLGAAGLRPATS